MVALWDASGWLDQPGRSRFGASPRFSTPTGGRFSLMRRVLLLAVLALTVAGCYHATVETGLRPSPVRVERKWAHGFLYGLVPPSTVETAARCPHGAAKVETKLSFLNQVAYALTWGLYSPMEIVVHCAEAPDASAVGSESR